MAAADIKNEDLVLEIGPGIGSMTWALARRAGHVIAVELDVQLIPVLKDIFANSPVTVIQGDILKIDLPSVMKQAGMSSVKVVANLPYYITTPVIIYLLESGLPFLSITVMVQKEVAARMAASPGTKDYGSLSLFMQYYADIRLVANVPVNSFMPRPAVDSAVVQLSLLPSPRVETDKDFLFKIIHAAFNQRRKTLVNALFSAGILQSKAQILEVLKACNLKSDIRGETLDIFAFAQLAEALGEK